MNITETLENFLCDLSDSVFNDGIVCDKIYNPEQEVNRAAFITATQTPEGDQDGLIRFSAQLLENRKKRSECIKDSELIRKNFKKTGHKLENGLVIYLDVQYITSPIKTIVDTQSIYTISANFNVKIK